MISNKEICQIKVDPEAMTNSKCEQLLGIKINYKLNFNKYVRSLYKKASQKQNFLSGIAYSMMFYQGRIIFNIKSLLLSDNKDVS